MFGEKDAKLGTVGPYGLTTQDLAGIPDDEKRKLIADIRRRIRTSGRTSARAQSHQEPRPR